MTAAVFTCHGVEWFEGDTCPDCSGVPIVAPAEIGRPGSYTAIAFGTGITVERERIAKSLEEKARTWTRQVSFSYPAALRELAAEIRKGR